MDSPNKTVPFGVAITNIFIILCCVGIGGALYKAPLDMSFLLAIILMGLILILVCKYKAKELLEYFFDGGRKAVDIMVLLMGIGALIGAWIVGGIVPTLIFYGLKFISPAFFLLTGFLLLCALSFFIGSAFATAGTVGVALMGIGAGMGFPPALTAGMVLSGSIFGNKLSPFADSSNLCVVATGVNLLDHIKSMCYTVIPIFVASAAVYAYLGISYNDATLDPTHVVLFMDTLQKYFVINPFLLLVPIATIVLIVKKVPPVIALLLTTIVGGIVALAVQGFNISTVASSISGGFSIQTGVANVDDLLNRGGIYSMLDVVELVFFLMGGGEILQRTGTTTAIMNKLHMIIRGKKSLIMTNLFAGLMVDGLTGSQYLSIILPGEMFKEQYKKFGVKLTVLSRTLEDSGTIFSYLLPWSNNAVAMGGILGVAITESYIYTYQLWFTPILAIICAVTGYAVWTEDNTEEPMLEEERGA
ncbi:Na+/H+ antiporter NhaC family protein [Aminipila terrae]|uniref:Na+/H+ antiporter NhaC n=1 Tax=Aminipila terrae TaxID=2697030 RepID=A0A6P1MJT7_9FIRM|nr:Na+/H+ antiporter NhaC family protein [Aminipila terrae]QHI72298.1 Na+/H+ antiporter NhaC [Aminipila terrae]